ncbi:DUF2809 domain-containing protein [Mucilaginibacter hurinus]|uniref:DUF2809 domain-containing protein n=1 Tax=Mucilaginibacter hurinus TaxID=2201324 RepID=A0A367GSK0_9SPHI|nr:DUF2809 domain-containing protein [Mucilaginibacter hurinus]RCH55826.1 DUF2809 domain-containing protein [Mucilaginibacter hurinus]
MKLDITYFLLFILLLVTEAIIALFLNDGFIRPYAGDFLVVMLMYCFAKSFAATPLLPTAIGVLLLAYLIELSQFFHLARLLGVQHSTIAQLLIGQAFSWIDMVAYTLGVITIIIIEKLRLKS